MTRIAGIVALYATLLVSGAAFAQQYPTRPVKIVIPFPAGGVTDIAGRLIAQKLSERLGQQFYIENIAGAGGNTGMANAARSPGDGYTILLSSSSIVVNPSLYSKMPFDAAPAGAGSLAGSSGGGGPCGGGAAHAAPCVEGSGFRAGCTLRV